MVTGTQDSPRGSDLLDHHCMEERARLKALEALFDPTTTARIVALPAAGEVVIAVEASPVGQYDLMMISGNDGYRRHLPAIMGTEGVGRAIAVGNAANDAVEQALSTTSLAELVRGGGYISGKCSRHGHVPSQGVTTMGRRANKHILITGGNSGIGRAAAQEFDREGARVAVKLDHVTRTYRRDEFEVRALDDVSLTIPTQGFVAIMGPSGSGKTTLLNLVAGIDHATSGSVVVGEEEITTMNERELAAWRARHIGLVFQFYNLIPVLTAFENVELPLLLTHLSKAERKTHVESALKAVGLADRMEHYPRQLSGGQEQRVAIARAIVTDPTILVADEPTGDLDATSAEEILLLLTQLNRQFHKTIVMVTHDPRSERFVDTVYRLDKGVFIGAEQGGMSAKPGVSLPPPA